MPACALVLNLPTSKLGIATALMYDRANVVGWIHLGTGEAMRMRRDCWERYHIGWWMVLIGATGLLWALLR